jgi:hypothetical protein
MLSLKYYGVVHRDDIDDYMQSLRSAQELDKNNFWYLMYAVKAKSTEEGPVLPKSIKPLTQYQSLMTMKKFKSKEQPSPSAGRFPTSIPPSQIPQHRHSSSELSTSAPNYFYLPSVLAVSNLSSLPMLLGGFLVGRSKNGYGKTSLILTQRQKDSRSRVSKHRIE